MKHLILVFTVVCFFSAAIANAAGKDGKNDWKWAKYGLEKTDNPCAVPVPYTGWQKSLYDARKKINYHQWGINAVFLGDSITALWNPDNTCPNGSKVLKEYKKKYKNINPQSFGVSGDEPQNLLWLITEGDILKGMNPKVITVMIGINSLNRKKSPEQVAGGIKSILKVLRKSKPDSKILLMGIWPCWGAKSPVRAKITKTNEIISKFADDKHIYFMDIGKEFVSSQGSMNTELIRDGIHPSEKGYKRWAELMFPKLAELMK